MLKWIRSFFAKKQRNDPASMDIDAINSQVEQVLALDLSSDASREEHGDFVLNVIRRLDTEIEYIRQQANGYPANPISGLVWMNGSMNRTPRMMKIVSPLSRFRLPWIVC
ncbi:MAG: hypothetical protein JXM70_17290 [Pirellulales bacterium]|nr:hypothetical protein [Pirellulales bacterium]